MQLDSLKRGHINPLPAAGISDERERERERSNMLPVLSFRLVVEVLPESGLTRSTVLEIGAFPVSLLS